VLRRASEKSAAEWAKVPRRPNIRVETMRRQQSTLLKVATLLYDETESRPRYRVKYFRHWFLYVAWAMIIVYLVGGLAYCARWVIARTSYRGTVDPNSTQQDLQNDADGIIVAWLLSAAVGVAIGVFLSEPVLQLIRFGVVPWVLRAFGNGTASVFGRRHWTSVPDSHRVEPEAERTALGKGFQDAAGDPVVASKQVDDESSRTTKKRDAREAGVVAASDSPEAPVATASAAAATGATGGVKRKTLLDQYRSRQPDGGPSKKRPGQEDGTTSRVVLEGLAEVMEALA